MTWKLDTLLSANNQIQQVTELPPIPALAQAVLQLKDDPSADARRLSQVINLDPGLAAQMMRYAGSALFGYRGKIESIHDAISRVLGYDKAMHIAVGMAAGQSLTHSADGPLGIRAFWRHALFMAALMQSLGNHVKVTPRPSPGLLYLAGLLHNIGFLLLGHLLKPEFNALNQAVANSRDEDILDIEMRVLGVVHTDLGARLLRKWKMPPEVLATAFSHHNEHYRGEYHVYANLAFIANCLLKRVDIGDAFSTELSVSSLQNLGLEQTVTERSLERLMDAQEGVDSVVAYIIGQ